MDIVEWSKNLATHPDTAEAEGNYAYRSGCRADDNPYLEGEMRERFNKGFWDARSSEISQNRRYVDQIFSLKKRLETAETIISYLQSKLPNYEDMIHDMEREWQ